MRCPKCQQPSAVTNSRQIRLSLRRRRECLTCKHRWSTFEVMYEEGQFPYRVCKVVENGQMCCKPVYEKAYNRSAKCQGHFMAYQRSFKRDEGLRRQSRKLKAWAPQGASERPPKAEQS